MEILFFPARTGEWRDSRKPHAYQEHDGVETPVDSRYVMFGNGLVGFAIGPHDSKKMLVIDPVLSYATYIGGSRDDTVSAIALDGAATTFI